MIDTHAHIDFNKFDPDRIEMLERAFKGGVKYIIIPGVEPKDYCRLLDLTGEYENLYCGMGVHPHNANEANNSVYDKIEENAGNKKVKAIGETGIDYFYDYSPKNVQKEVFRSHLIIAKNLDLPVIVHNREADEDVLNIIKEEQNGNLRGVLHCFSSPVNVMEKALGLGFNISFTGNITFRKSNLDEVVRHVPNDRFMLETDSPFMTPVPHRGERNEPSFIKHVAQKIAEIKSISIDEVITMTSKTATEFFRLAVLLIFFLFSIYCVNAQSVVKDLAKEDIPEEEETENPYDKFIGIGPVFGTNTVVETYYLGTAERDVSYPGLFAIGAAISYGVFDYLVIEGAYVYSKNTQIVKEQKNLVAPSIYQNIELSSQWIINPYSRVNFYGIIGLTSFFNSFNKVPDKQIGWKAGLGFYINIPFKYGLFNVAAEWKINFETRKKNQFYYDPDKKNIFPKESKSFYSIPRVTLFYYPPLRGINQ